MYSSALPFCLLTISGLYQYEPPPPAHLLCPNIGLSPRRYQHRGARRIFHFDRSKPLQSFWSSTLRSPRNFGRSVNHSALAYTARMATAPAGQQSCPANFCLFNIRSLMNEGHHIHDLLITIIILIITWIYLPGRNLAKLKWRFFTQRFYPLWVCLHL